MKSRCCNLCRKSFCHNITEGLCVSSWALCDNCEKEVRRAIFLKDRNKDGIGEHSYFEDDDKNRDDYDVFLAELPLKATMVLTSGNGHILETEAPNRPVTN